MIKTALAGCSFIIGLFIAGSEGPYWPYVNFVGLVLVLNALILSRDL